MCIWRSSRRQGIWQWLSNSHDAQMVIAANGHHKVPFEDLLVGGTRGWQVREVTYVSLPVSHTWSAQALLHHEQCHMGRGGNVQDVSRGINGFGMVGV